MRMEGFILGLSSGVLCAAACAPVLIPYLLGEGRGIALNAWLTLQFLAGRLFGYLVFGLLAWAASLSLSTRGAHRDWIIGGAYVFFSALLISYGFFRQEASRRKSCFVNRCQKWIPVPRPALLPCLAGLITGLSFCPPLMLAFAGAAARSGLGESLLYFLSFFAGTSVLFVFAPFAGALKRFPVARTVGKLAAGVIGVYYFYSGSMMILGGLLR